MDNKYLIYESGYLSFDIIQTEKKRVTSHSFQFFFILFMPIVWLYAKITRELRQDIICFELLGLGSI